MSGWPSTLQSEISRQPTLVSASKNSTVTEVDGAAQIARAAGPGEIALKAVSGDVLVAIRRGLRVRLDVNSVSGTIGSELDVSDTPLRADGPEANLRVRTVSGDVRITRAAEAVA